MQIVSLSRFVHSLFVCSLVATGLLVVGCDSGGSSSSSSSDDGLGVAPDKITDGRIAFSLNSDPTVTASSSEIYTVGTDGKPNNVTNNDASDSQPTWSPDGNRIGFRRGGIRTIKPDGSDLKQVTEDGGFDLAWSPDGSRFAFVDSRDGDLLDDIYTIKTDGSDLKQVASSDVTNNYNPAWSPDGKRIAFESDRLDDDADNIYTINSDGSDLKQVTNSEFADVEPAWSPDGSRIAFSRSSESGGDLSQTKIYTIKPNGSDLKQVTDQVPDQDPDRDVSDSAPAWSPDGSRIVFVSNNYLFTISPDGSNVKRITNQASRIEEPAWGPSQ